MIISYDEKYDKQLAELEQLMFYYVKYHPDVIKDSVYLAVENEKLLGVAFLQKRSSFLAIEHENVRYHELIIHYELDYTYSDCNNILVQLLDKLKENCDSISMQYPGKRIFMKAWLPEEAHDRIELLMKHGFTIGRGTPILVRKLDDCGYIDTSVPMPLKVRFDDRTEHLEIRELAFDEKTMAAYEAANANAFIAPDSTGDLWFKLNDPEVKVFAALKEDKIISSVTVWRVGEKRAATENIFCISDFRRKGITGAVINYACSYLKQCGYEEASLTVFQDNIPAFLLYEKLGYRYEKMNFGLQYEKDYVAIPY
jgi:ribosomal protein S18 acetylase RimI-like enzyme